MGIEDQEQAGKFFEQDSKINLHSPGAHTVANVAEMWPGVRAKLAVFTTVNRGPSRLSATDCLW
jgi:hypothetical protein